MKETNHFREYQKNILKIAVQVKPNTVWCIISILCYADYLSNEFSPYWCLANFIFEFYY